MSDMIKTAALIQLAGAVSHELNNIFTAALGNLSLLDDHVAQEGMAAEVIEETVRTIQRGVELAEKLQAFAGRQPLQRRQLRVNDFLREAARQLRSHMPQGVELVFMPRSGNGTVLIDADKLRQVIGELVDNAVAAIDGAGKIYICTDDEQVTGQEGHALVPGAYIVIRVFDTGSGMTPHVAARVTDPTFSTKSSLADAGWGLSQCAGFMRQSGGVLKVFSVPRHCTAIDLYLPVQGAASAGAGEESDPVSACA